MDLAYLRAHPAHLPAFLTHQRIRETPVPGGSICRTSRLTLDDGSSLFTKSRTGAPEHFFATEAAGLAWLAEAGAVPVPEVIAVLPEMLALEWVEPGAPTAAAAERFGRELAALHRAGAPRFGADWPGFIGELRQDNGSDPEWTTWFAERRLRPYLKLSRDNGALSAADIALVESLVSTIDRYAPAAEAPSRLHGDLWPGNLLWGADGRVWLVDPAAHGGHRETDLAELALFGGTPHLERILATYDETFPLADGWRRRVPLHQLHLLLVHTAMFGAAYRGSVLSAVRATV